MSQQMCYVMQWLMQSEAFPTYHNFRKKTKMHNIKLSTLDLMFHTDLISCFVGFVITNTGNDKFDIVVHIGD